MACSVCLLTGCASLQQTGAGPGAAPPPGVDGATPPPAARPAGPPSAIAPASPAAAPVPSQAPAAPPAPSASARPPEARAALDVKYVRDSEEYATLARQIYRLAAEAVDRGARALPAGTTWAAVLDVDETALDNSTYQLDRAAYGLPFDNASWNAWVRRLEARPVPGVADFVAAVRRAGGRIAWITNRDEEVRDATIANLRAHGLWDEADRLCLATPDAAYTKAVRRRELVSGQGACAWSGAAVRVLVYVGDQMGDFPARGEPDPDAGQDAAFGRRLFLLPNPMYGSWTSRVTRTP
jgi:5'-nucleotidase (lipoprotein e(P4) family)